MFSPYKSRPITVEAVFDTEGNVSPVAVLAEGERYNIDKIYSVRSYNPVGIPGGSKEFICKIGKHRRRLYYHKGVNMWWSLK